MPEGYGYGPGRKSKAVGNSGGMSTNNPGGPIHGKVNMAAQGRIEGGRGGQGGGNNIRGTNHVPHPPSSRPTGEVMCGPKSVSMGKPQGFGGRGPI